MQFLQRQRLLLVGSIVLSLAIGFGGGYFYFRQQNTKTVDTIIKKVINKDEGKTDAVDFALFWQVWDKLHQQYFDKDTLDSQKLVYGAIEGMVAAAGDPYTVFFEPVVSKKFQEQVSGAFSGVGMEIDKRNGLITVIAPIRDSPAMRAGIKAGDVVAKVDGASTEAWSVEEAVGHIRGKQGTTVILTIAREGESDFFDVSIVRDTIKVPALDLKMLDNKVAYLQIFTFNGNLNDEFARAAKEIADAGAERLIIDMRNNPGGLLDSAVNLGGWMLKGDSLVVQERYSTGLSDDLRANGNGKLASIPTVVLINGGSASAAEILAGALHDIRGVPLVGEKSFGKGSVQQIENFYNGASLKVTVAKWFTPNGVNISAKGIEPTYEVKIDAKEFKEKGWELTTVGKDPQLDKAIEVVKALR
jgi:carboxyl-terminal processing protease